MSVFKHRYTIEVRTGQDQRTVEADSFAQLEDWLVFYRKPATGGPAIEYWRIKVFDVVCMETKVLP